MYNRLENKLLNRTYETQKREKTPRLKDLRKSENLMESFQQQTSKSQKWKGKEMKKTKQKQSAIKCCDAR